MNTEAKQIATLPAPNSKSNASRAYQDKPLLAAWSLIAPNAKGTELNEIIIVRWYMSAARSATTVYCNVWIHGNTWTSGHGQAGGGGYHKQSSALEAALNSAGVKLSQSIDGRGDGAMQSALAAIVEAMGYKPYGSEFLIIKH